MNINKLVEKGESALKKRNYDYAISIFLEAVNFAPDNRRARENLRKAELKKYEASYPSSIAVAVFGFTNRLGMFVASLGKKGNPEAYMMACERFLTPDPKNKNVNMALGGAAAMAGHLNTAIFAYETASEHNPDDVSALKKLGELLWRNGEIQRAHEIYSNVVSIAPQDQDAVKARKNLAAEASLKETGFETAGSSLDLVKDKKAAGRLMQAERLHKTEDDLGAQREQLEQRVAESPEDVDLIQDLAEVYQKLKEWDKALQTMDKAVAVKPNDINIQIARGDLELLRLEEQVYALQRDGKTAEAGKAKEELLHFKTDEYRKRVKAYPTDLKLRFALGDLLFQQDQVDEAIGQFQQTVRDPKHKGDSLLRLGRAFSAKGQHDLGIRQLEQALEGHSGFNDRVKEIYYEMAVINTARGNKAQAKEIFNKIYEVDISYKDVADRLQELDAGSDEGKLSLSE